MSVVLTRNDTGETLFMPIYNKKMGILPALEHLQETN
jgi:hypothetical protein